MIRTDSPRGRPPIGEPAAKADRVLLQSRLEHRHRRVRGAGTRTRASAVYDRGVFLLFGTRASEAVLAMVVFACEYCGTTAAQRVFERVNKITLFFVPLFPVSRKYFVECSHCRRTTGLSKDQVDSSIAWAAANQHPTT